MATTIKGTDIIESNALKDAIDDAEKLKKAYDELDEVLNKVNQNAENISKGNKGKTAKQIQDLNKALKDTNSTRDQAIKIDKEREKLDAKLKMLRSDKIQQTEQLKVLISEQRKINKDLAKEEAGLTGEYKKQSKRLRDLKNSYKDLVLAEGESAKGAKEMKDEITELDKRLKDLDKSVGDNFRSVGDYRGAIKDTIVSVKDFAGALGVLGALDIAKEFVSLNVELAKTESIANALFDTTGSGGRQLAKDATIIAKTYGEDVNEVLRTANVLQEEFGKTGEEALALIEEGFDKGLNASGELLENVKEYATQLRVAGLSAEESFAIIAETQDRGVFSDKGIDAIKEATIRLREMTPATQEALSAIGMSADQVQKDIQSGAKTYFEVIQEISAKTNEFGDTSQQAGMILADVFGGAGEDAGKFVFELDQLNTSFEDVEDRTSKFQKGIQDIKKAFFEYVLGGDAAGNVTDRLGEIMSWLADNMETILDTVKNVVVWFGSYKAVVKAAEVTTNLLGKTMGNLKRSIGLFGVALFGVVEIFKGFVQLWEESNAIQNGAIKLQDEINDQLVKEKANLRSVGVELLKTNAGSEERSRLIKEINEEYGTTLENLEDEAQFMRQLTIEYEKYVKQLEKRIAAQVIEKQLVEATEKLLELRQQQAQQGSDFGVGLSGTQQGAIDRQKEWIATLQQSLFALKANNTEVETTEENIEDLGDTVSETGGKVKGATEEIKKLKKLSEEEFAPFKGEAFDPIADFESTKKQLENNLRELERELRKSGKTQEEIDEELSEQKLENLKEERERALELFGEYSDQYLDADLALRREIDRRNAEQEKEAEEARKKELEAQKKKQEELFDSFKKLSNETMNLIQSLADEQVAAIDRAIERLNSEIQDSQSIMGELREQARLGNTDAAESLKAERIAQARDKAEIERLEKKKRDLLITISSLNLANNFFQQGSLDGYKKAKAKVTNFIKELPTFYDGTDKDVQSQLGRTGVKDGHIVRVHDNEHIVGAKDASRLHKAGIYKTGDIVEGALAYYNSDARRAINMPKLTLTDKNIVSKLDNVEKAVKNIRIVQQHIDLSTGTETIIDGNKIIKNDHRPKKLTI